MPRFHCIEEAQMEFRAPNSSATMPLTPNLRVESGKKAYKHMPLTLESRNKAYKQGLDPEKARTLRDKNFKQTRQHKREDNVKEKRREVQQIQSCANLAAITRVIAGLWSADASLQLEAIIQFKTLLSLEQNPPIDQLISVGIVPRIVHFLTRDDFHHLQYEAAWALTNIASGTAQHAKVVIDHGALTSFMHILTDSPSSEVREQAVWAIGNLCAHSPEHRDVVLCHGALMAFLAQLNQDTPLSMLRTVTCGISNLFHGKPQLPLEHTQQSIAALGQLILVNDEEVLRNACRALSYVSSAAEERIEDVIKAGVCPRLVQLLLCNNPAVVIPALRTVGNIVGGNDAQTQFMIDNQVLPQLSALLTHNDMKTIKKEICWTVSNITAGTEMQIQAVIDANIIPFLVQLLQTGDFEIRKYAAFAVSSAASGGSQEQTKYLANQGCMKALCDLLDCQDRIVVTECLDGLIGILKVGLAEKELGKAYAQHIEDVGGLEKIKILQNHKNSEVHEKAVKLVEAYVIFS